MAMAEHMIVPVGSVEDSVLASSSQASQESVGRKSDQLLAAMLSVWIWEFVALLAVDGSETRSEGLVVSKKEGK